MKHPVAILISACLASAVFIGWRVHAVRHHSVNHFELVYDPSRSYRGGCPSMVGSAEEVLRNSGVSVDSTLTVLVLGDNSTAHEPTRLATYPIPVSRKVIEGKLATVRRQDDLLLNLWTRCRSMRPTLVTPLYLGVKQAVADLRAHGCTEGSRCGLWVATDLEENGDRAIEGRLNRGREAKEPLPKPLDNSGIKVTFCGYAATSGRSVDPSLHKMRKGTARDPNREDRLQDVWRGLFTSPDLVSFEPYCPEPTSLQAYETSAVPKK